MRKISGIRIKYLYHVPHCLYGKHVKRGTQERLEQIIEKILENRHT